MRSVPTKITGNTYTATEFNELPSQELQNAVLTSGQILSSGDLNQLGKAMAVYGSAGDFYTDGGSANTYVLTPIGTPARQAPPTYVDGVRVRFVAGNSNTGASTINLNGLGVKSLKENGVDIAVERIKSGEIIEAVFLVTSDRFELVSVYDGVKNVLLFGTPTDGATSGSTEIQATIDSIVITAGTVNPGSIEFPVIKKNYVINTQLEIDQKNIDFIGNNVALKWEGNNTTAMMRITDSSRCHFNNFIFLGDLATPPTAGMFFDAPAPLGTKGTNENMVISGCIFGRRFLTDTTTGGSADATPAGRLQSCVIIGGVIDGNNDEYHFVDCQFHSATNFGLDLQNTQSIWSLLTNCLFNDNDIGFQQGANITAHNIVFNRNVTADIKGIRQTVMSIFGLNAENSKVFIESNAGASYYVNGGKLLRNDVSPSFFFNTNSGGDMVLENLLVDNVQAAVADTIRYKGGSAGGIFKVRNCTITGGDNRDTWDINTSITGNNLTIIDIEHGLFKFKTTEGYGDHDVTPPLVGAEADEIISISPVDAITGEFVHTAYQLDPQAQHIVNAVDGGAVARVVIFNPTGAGITLAQGRMRWFNVGEHIIAEGSVVVDPPSIANGAAFLTTIPVAGARLGDYTHWAVDGTFTSLVVTSYVSADDTVTLVMHNATGGSVNPGSETFRAAKINEFGNFQGGVVHTPALIANGANAAPINITVPGTQLGGHVFVSYTQDLQGLVVTAHVSAVDTVTIIQSNRTGVGVTLAAGSFKVQVAF